MGEFKKYSEKFLKKENKAVAEFLKALSKQKRAVESDSLNRRSWVRANGDAYEITLGKLEGVYELESAEQVSEFLNRVATLTRTDVDLIADIEAAYSEPETKKTRKKRDQAEA